MEKAEWIWLDKNNEKDSYVHFISDFNVTESNNIILKIACDSNFTVYINGELAGFSQYHDYPYYKIFDKIDISEFVKTGKNRIAVCGYYCGEEFMTYYKGNAGLIFEITEKNNIALYSDSNILCRKGNDYKNGNQIKITGQLGYSYYYDMSKYDGWNKKEYCNNDFKKSVIIKNITKELHSKPVERLILEKRAESKLIKFGSFEYCGGDTAGEKQQKAIINYDADLNDKKITVKSGGVYALFDMGREEVGFLNFKIKVNKNIKILIGYGEHLTDGRARTYIDGRNFSAEYLSKDGRQEYLNTFVRFGARYLQIFAETDSIEIEYLTLRPTMYPVKINEFKAENELRQKIYDTSVRTLQLCMHEHYEDCPWREQGLYTMDSRNQMLCGYYAFSEQKFARASLKLIGLDKRKDGLLSICYPSNIDLKIPSFSLYYIIEMKEYIQYTNDITLAEELFDKLELILSVFENRIKNNLVPIFYGDNKSWNFYEWSEGLEGHLFAEDKEEYDLILNSLYSLALQDMTVIAKAVNRTQNSKKYTDLYNKINKAINENFYDEKKNLYKMNKSDGKQIYSILGNSLAVLCGAADSEKSRQIAVQLTENKEITDITLSMSCFKYDALLKTNKEKYADYILKDIDNKYKFMLDNNATTFWETIKGESDFENAGSLCHGWSAMPIYYYQILKSRN